jgi:tRNA(adenine34) deaminase
LDENTDQDWIRASLAEASKVVSDVPVGSVLVLEGKIIGRGHNLRELSGDPTSHAEIVAIRQAAEHLGTWRLTGTTLYSTLEPCPMCAEAIIQSRVSKLVFGAYDSRSGAAGSAFNLFVPGRPYPVPEVLGGILEQECKAMLVQYFRQVRKE